MNTSQVFSSRQIVALLVAFESRAVSLDAAVAEIEALIEIERVQLRDTFAGQALITAAAYSHADVTTWDAEDFAKHSYAVADAMLEARKS